MNGMARRWCAVAAMAIGIASPAVARDKVEVSQARAGPASGMLTRATAGDAACYLTIRDTAGRTEDWPAAFEMCGKAPPLLHRDLAFTWTQANVLHPDCQGNADCGRSLRVMIVTGMRPR